MNTLINGFKLTRLLACVTPFVLLCLRSSKINLLIDNYIYFYNHQRIQLKTGVAPLTLRHSA